MMNTQQQQQQYPNQMNGMPQHSQEQMLAEAARQQLMEPMVDTYLGQYPNTKFCCCLQVPLKAGVLSIVYMSLIGSFVAMIYMLFLVSEVFDTDLITVWNYILTGLQILQGIGGIIGFQGVREMNMRKVKQFAYILWAFTAANAIIFPISQYASCEKDKDEYYDRYFDDEDTEDKEDFKCRSTFAVTVISMLIMIAFMTYLQYTMWSFWIRYEAGQEVLVTYGHPKVGPPMTGPRGPHVVDGIQVNNSQLQMGTIGPNQNIPMYNANVAYGDGNQGYTMGGNQTVQGYPVGTNTTAQAGSNQAMASSSTLATNGAAKAKNLDDESGDPKP